jgi:Paraquat-inducible protein B
VARKESPRTLQLVWIVPIVAALVGAGIAVKAFLDRGPSITIEFRTAEGIEAGKTKIKYKAVDVGTVRSVKLSPDHKHAIVTAEMAPDAKDFLVDDTRFWIVRPRIAGGEVSGLPRSSRARTSARTRGIPGRDGSSSRGSRRRRW